MKKNKSIFLYSFSLIFLLMCCQVSAQNKKIDSLLGLIKTDKEDTNKVIHQYILSREYANVGVFDKGLLYGKQALTLAQSLNFKKGVAYSYNYLGVTYFNYGNYPEALKNYFASLKAHEDTKDKQGIAIAYNNIGNVYKEQGDSAEALKNLFLALKISKELGDKNGIARVYNNIGNIYHSNGNYEQALKMHFAALKLLEEINDKHGIAVSHNNIGTVYFNKGDYPKAEENYFASLKIREEINDRNGMASSFINLGELYLKQNKIRESKEYLDKGLELSTQIGSRDALKDCFSDLAILDSAMGNFKEAFAHHKLFMIYRDSLNNEETKKKSIQAAMQYEFDKKEIAAKAEQDKADILNAEEKGKQRNIIYTITSILIVVILFSAFLYSRFRIIKRQRNQIESNLIYTKKLQDALEDNLNYYMQLALRKQMNPHFIFNSLNSIQSFILQNDKFSASQYLSEFSNLMRKVLENSEHKYITIKEELETLKLYIQLEQKRFEDKFEFDLMLPDDMDGRNFLIPPLLLQPYVENAIWHGLLHKTEKGILQIDVHRVPDKILFTITDNGVGREESAKRRSAKYSSHESLGTKITAKRLELINSLNNTDFLVEYKDLKDGNNNPIGTTVTIIIPIRNVLDTNINSEKA
jgi:tetratricopeptide (TPR) repeat protein